MTLAAPQRDIPKHKVQEIKPRGKGDGDNYAKDTIQKKRTVAEEKSYRIISSNVYRVFFFFLLLFSTFI